MAYERRFPSQTRDFGPSISQFAQQITGDRRLTPDFTEEEKRLASNQAYIPGSEIPFQPQQHGNVLSGTEGWANVFGDVFEAYGARKAAEAKAKEKEDRDRDIVKAILEAGNLGGGVAGETTPPLPGTIPLESLDPEEFEQQYREQLEGLPSIPDFAQQIATPTMGGAPPGVQPQGALQGVPQGVPQDALQDVPTDVQLAQQITPQQMGGAPPGVQPQGVPQGALQGVPTTGPASWQQRFAAMPQFQPSFPQGASVQTFTERQTPSESWQEAYANLAKRHPDAAIEYLDTLKATAKSAAPVEDWPIETIGGVSFQINPLTKERVALETLAEPEVSSFQLMLNELNDLDPDDPDRIVSEARILKEVHINEGKGSQVMFEGADGDTVTITEGDFRGQEQGASPFFRTLETKGNRDRAYSDMEFTNAVIEQINFVIKKAEADPSILGVPGAIRKKLQAAVGIASDVADFVLPGTDLLAKLHLGSTKSDLSEDLRNIIESYEPGALNEEQTSRMARYLEADPTVAALLQLENNIALALAKNRSAGRLLADVLKMSVNEVQLTGWQSQKDVVSRLLRQRKTLQGQADRLKWQSGRGGTRRASQRQPSLAERWGAARGGQPLSKPSSTAATLSNMSDEELHELAKTRGLVVGR